MEKDINYKMIAFLLFKTYHFLLEIFFFENKKFYLKFKDGNNERIINFMKEHNMID